MIYNTIHRKP